MVGMRDSSSTQRSSLYNHDGLKLARGDISGKTINREAAWPVRWRGYHSRRQVTTKTSERWQARRQMGRLYVGQRGGCTLTSCLRRVDEVTPFLGLGPRLVQMGGQGVPMHLAGSPFRDLHGSEERGGSEQMSESADYHEMMGKQRPKMESFQISMGKGGKA